MKKALIVIGLLLAIAVGGGIYYLLTNLNPIVEAAIEDYGSAATQTTVGVDGVDIRLREGRARIAGIAVGNPDGFAADDAFVLENITVDINVQATTGDLVVFEELTINQPRVFFEVNAQGQDNLSILKERLAKFQTDDTAPGPNLKIGRLQFSDASVSANIIPANRQYELRLPSLNMDQLGGASGASPGQIAREIIDRLLDHAMARVKEEGVNRALDGVKQQLESRGRELLEGSGSEEIQQQARDSLDNLLN
jgi:hypothetical protein